MIDQQKGIYTAPGVAGLYSLIAIRSSRRITQLRSQRPTSTWPVRLQAKHICSRRVQAGLDFINFQHYCKEERCINDTTVPSVIVRWVPGILNSVVDLTLRSLTELSMRTVSPVFYGLSSVSLAPLEAARFDHLQLPKHLAVACANKEPETDRPRVAPIGVVHGS